MPLPVIVESEASTGIQNKKIDLKKSDDPGGSLVEPVYWVGSITFLAFHAKDGLW